MDLSCNSMFPDVDVDVQEIRAQIIASMPVLDIQIAIIII